MELAQLAALASVVACAVAILAVYVALSQRTLASKAYHLAIAQDERRDARVEVQIADGSSLRLPDGRWILIEAVVTNPTDVDTTLVSARLRIAYRLGDVDTALILDHEAHVDDSISRMGELPIPGRLPSNGAVKGLVAFFLPRGLLSSEAIESFQLVLRDARGASATHDLWAPREVTDGK